MNPVRRITTLLAAGGLLATLAGAQDVGSRLPSIDLKDYTQTQATSFEDFAGRAVLIEFFAYW
jgi:hypothetical protein